MMHFSQLPLNQPSPATGSPTYHLPSMPNHMPHGMRTADASQQEYQQVCVPQEVPLRNEDQSHLQNTLGSSASGCLDPDLTLPSTDALVPTPTDGDDIFFARPHVVAYPVRLGCEDDAFPQALAGVDSMTSSGSPAMSPVILRSHPAPPISSQLYQNVSSQTCAHGSPSSPPESPLVASEQDVFDPRNLDIGTTVAARLPGLPNFCFADDEEYRTLMKSGFSHAAGVEITVPIDLFNDASLPSFEPVFEFNNGDDFNGMLYSGGECQYDDATRESAELVSGFVDDAFFSEESFSDDDLSNSNSPPCGYRVSLDFANAKSQRKTTRSEIVHAAAAERFGQQRQSVLALASHSHCYNSQATAPASVSTCNKSRPGRKQSLRDDPSKIFPCKSCSRRFKRQEHLSRHYRSLHTHERPFQCADCGKSFSRSDNLNQHQRTHDARTMVVMLHPSQGNSICTQHQSNRSMVTKLGA